MEYSNIKVRVKTHRKLKMLAAKKGISLIDLMDELYLGHAAPHPAIPRHEGVRDTAQRVLVFLNEKAHRQYQPVEANLTMILARLREGYSEEELNQIITLKSRQWCGMEMEKYLRPATIFNATKCAQYRGELVEPDPFAGDGDELRTEVP